MNLIWLMKKKEYYKSRLVELTKTEEENEKIKETLESFVGAPVDAIKVFFDTIDAMLGAYAEGGAQGVMDAAKLVTDAVDEAVEQKNKKYNKKHNFGIVFFVLKQCVFVDKKT